MFQAEETGPGTAEDLGEVSGLVRLEGGGDGKKPDGRWAGLV